jgi:Cu/Ag efflux protein CusF
MQRRTSLLLTGATLMLAVLGGRAFAQEWIDAEVRRIDKEGARLTLKHAEIKSMDMPAMTMVFRVRDKAMLEGLSVGDRVRVQAVREAGQFVVVELRRAP